MDVFRRDAYMPFNLGTPSHWVREREADEETDELLFALGCSVHREGLSLHHLWNDALKLSPFRLPIFLAECRAIFCRLDDIFRADLVFNQRTGFSRSDVPRQGKASTKVKLEPPRCRTPRARYPLHRLRVAERGKLNVTALHLRLVV